ncbi:MAG: DUF3472 domain-containing protein [Mucinivorans sp.]
MRKILLLSVVICFAALNFVCQAQSPTFHNIDFKGNSYPTADGVTSLYFRNDSTGALRLQLIASGVGVVKVEVLGKNFTAKFDNKKLDSVDLGTIKTKKAGYIKVDFVPQASAALDLWALKISGAANGSTLSYVHDFSTYWGSRGPSVHLGYSMPDEPVRWVYNEVTVPKGDDVVGSYYMANGFGEGYFGMQCNSPSERRVLFSVWSPYVTDDPKSIPQEDQIKLLARGPGVHIGEFGNEGSGGQSYLIFPWVAGNTYKFLTSITPDGNGSTTYTSYFYAPESGAWRKIASFLRPKTDKHYTRAHSFLENFIPDQGYVSRCVLFGNQWARTVGGEWREMCRATFTYDATAQAGVRKDYAGGVVDGQFFLKNCGFFDQNTVYRTTFERPHTGRVPDIDFEALKKL